jgi:hypothetical protein
VSARRRWKSSGTAASRVDGLGGSAPGRLVNTARRAAASYTSVGGAGNRSGRPVPDHGVLMINTAVDVQQDP